MAVDPIRQYEDNEGGCDYGQDFKAHSLYSPCSPSFRLGGISSIPGESRPPQIPRVPGGLRRLWDTSVAWRLKAVGERAGLANHPTCGFSGSMLRGVWVQTAHQVCYLRIA